MPRKSPYAINLSQDERRELQRRAASYTLPYFQVARAKMMLLASQGLPNSLIAQRLDTRREVVSLWRKRFFEHRLEGLEELPRPGRTSGIAATVSKTTVWRWLHHDAIRPWQHRCWIFPRDPDFPSKAGRILDLYHRTWQGAPLHESDFVISADEKTSIQARQRRHPTLPPQPGQPAKVEHEYKRLGAWAYLAARDVHRAKLFGRCESKSGIAPFQRLVDQVMQQPPYRQARRVFWIVDNGSAHRGLTAIRRLRQRYANLLLVHTPVHASWLNQVEVYFSVLQRKALTPNDFDSLDDLGGRLHAFERYYEALAKPFEWKFTRKDLDDLLRRMKTPGLPRDQLVA